MRTRWSGDASSSHFLDSWSVWIKIYASTTKFSAVPACEWYSLLVDRARTSVCTMQLVTHHELPSFCLSLTCNRQSKTQSKTSTVGYHAHLGITRLMLTMKPAHMQDSTSSRLHCQAMSKLIQNLHLFVFTTENKIITYLEAKIHSASSSVLVVIYWVIWHRRSWKQNAREYITDKRILLRVSLCIIYTTLERSACKATASAFWH